MEDELTLSIKGATTFAFDGVVVIRSCSIRFDSRFLQHERAGRRDERMSDVSSNGRRDDEEGSSTYPMICLLWAGDVPILVIPGTGILTSPRREPKKKERRKRDGEGER